MHALLTRLLISSAGATVATSALVFTAENRDRDLRRPRKKRKKKKSGAKAGKKSGAKSKGAAKSRTARTEDPLARARLELDSGSEPLAFDAFFANVKNTPRAVADLVSGKAAREKKEAKQRRADARAAMTPQERRAADRKRKRKKKSARPEEDSDWGIGASIRAEVKKQVKEAATDTIRETAEAAGDRLRDSAEVVKEKTSEVSKRIAEAAPDVAASAKSVADGAQRLTRAIADNVPESTEGAKRGLRSLGRWVEGPGAQAYAEDEDGPKMLAGESDAVEAKTATPANADDATDHAKEAKRLEAVKDEAQRVAEAESAATEARSGRSIVARRLAAAKAAAEGGNSRPTRSEGGRVRPVSSDDHEPDHDSP